MFVELELPDGFDELVQHPWYQVVGEITETKQSVNGSLAGITHFVSRRCRGGMRGTNERELRQNTSGSVTFCAVRAALLKSVSDA